MAKKMNLTALMATPEFRALSTQQRIFVAACIAGGIANDKHAAVAACQKAYPKLMLRRDPKTSIRGWASRLTSNPRIKKVIHLHRDLNEWEMLREDVQTLIKRSRRKDANMYVLAPLWLRVAAALEALAGKV